MIWSFKHREWVVLKDFYHRQSLDWVREKQGYSMGLERNNQIVKNVSSVQRISSTLLVNFPKNKVVGSNFYTRSQRYFTFKQEKMINCSKITE